MAQVEEEVDFNKLSVEERIQHKNWKARVSGYEALLNVFNTEVEPKSTEFSKYLAVLKKTPLDSNVTAQEKGLAVLLAFVQNSHPSISGKIASDVVNGCLVKGQLSSRAKTKELVLEIVLMYIEIEKCDVVQEELLKALENKTPKVVSGTIGICRESIRQFGPKWCKLTPLLKVLPSLFENKDKNIREEVKQLTVEIYRWLKDALKPQLQGLKPVQLTELDGVFAKVQDGKPTPTRYLLSQQARVPDAGTTETDGASEKPGDAPEEAGIDPFELLEPVEILSKLSSDFYEQTEAKKWQDRKTALENFQQLLNTAPKLPPGDYGELVKTIRKMVAKDTNVVVVGIAAKCLADLAAKMRKHFTPYAHGCVTVILDKFKEKKQSVVVPLREAIDATMVSIPLESVLEDVVSALDNKNPQIKSETTQFITRYTLASPTYVTNKKLLKTLIMALIKTLSDMDGGVRDAAAEALGTIMKAAGEKTLAPLLQEVDAIKMGKVKEFFEKAQVKTVVAAPKPPPVAKPKSIRGGPPPSKQLSGSQTSLKSGNSVEDLSKENKPTLKKATKSTSRIAGKGDGKATIKKTNGTIENGGPPSGPVTRSKSKLGSAPAKTEAKQPEISSLPLLPVNNLKDQRFADEKALRVLKWNFTAPREEFFQQLKEQMTAGNWNENLIANCFRNDFKFHIKAIESLTDFLAQGNAEATICNSDLILKWFALRFFDTNPTVILKAFDYLIVFFEAFKSSSLQLSDTEANSFIPYLIQKAGDPKNVFRQKVHEILQVLKHIYPPSKLFNFVLNGLTTKNARQRATCLDELAFLIESFGMAVCQPTASQALKDIGKQIGDKDSAVRNAALNCVVQAYFIEGEKVYKLIGHLSDKDLCMLEERIKRASKNRPVKPPPVAAAPTGAVGGKKQDARKPRSPSPIPMEEEDDESPERPPISSPKKASPVSPTRGEAHLMKTPTLEDLNLTVTKRPLTGKGTFTRQRPKSTALLSLDLKDIEKSFRREAAMESPMFASNGVLNATMTRRPRESAEELLNLPDVELPKRRSFSAFTSTASLIDREDRTVNSVMAQLTSHEIHVVIEALVQLRELISKPDEAEEFLSSKVDQLLILCNIQYRLILQKHMDDEKIPKAKVIDLYKVVTSVIDSLFKNKALGKKVSRDVLKDLVTIIISILLDQRVAELSEGPNIIRTVNMLATCIITCSESTNMLSALIKLLHECIAGNSNQTYKFTEMVMKCIWKMTRLMDSFMNELNIDRILYDIHTFFEAFPVDFWKSNPSRDDTPLRTIKTVAFILVKNKKDAIYNNLTMIPNMEKTELYFYIQRALKQITKENESENPSPRPSSGSPASKLSKQDHQQLSRIITKLGTPNTQEGLFELYEFCETRPSFNLESYLQRSTSEFFYSFIINGLQQIRVEREKLNQSKTPTKLNNGCSTGGGSVDTSYLSSATPKLPPHRQSNNFIPPLSNLGPFEQRNVKAPQFPSPEALNLNNCKDWYIDCLTYAGVDRNTIEKKAEMLFSETNCKYSDDPDRDLEEARVTTSNFLERVKAFKEFCEK